MLPLLARTDEKLEFAVAWFEVAFEVVDSERSRNDRVDEEDSSSSSSCRTLMLQSLANCREDMVSVEGVGSSIMAG